VSNSVEVYSLLSRPDAPTGSGGSRRLVTESRDGTTQVPGLRYPTLSRSGCEIFGGPRSWSRDLCFAFSAQTGNGLQRYPVHNGIGHT